MLHKIAVIAGDGIGPEVVAASLPVIERAATLEGGRLAFEMLPYSADHYLRTGVTLPDDAFRHLRDEVDAIFLGALGDPRVPDNEHARDILLGLRFKLDLYINFRPVVLLHPRLTPLSNAPPSTVPSSGRTPKGQYQAIGRSENVGTPEEKQVSRGDSHQERRPSHHRSCVRLGSSSRPNPHYPRGQVQRDPISQDLGTTLCRSRRNYPAITREHRYVDALAMELVREPGQFQVIVANNLYGDILSDLGAGLVGGLGVAASANLHPGRAGLFEPVHGSAPPLAGKNVANPMAAVLTGALMLESLGFTAAAARLDRSVRAVLADGPATPDIGGTSGTTEVARALLEAVG